MNVFARGTRMLLIGVCVYGDYSICVLLKRIIPKKEILVIIFIVILVLSLWSLIDWKK